jgi:putative ABC transport system permease protein
LFVAQPWIDKAYGLYIPITAPTSYELSLLGCIIAAGILAGLLPALRAYRLSLSDGMMVRV